MEVEEIEEQFQSSSPSSPSSLFSIPPDEDPRLLSQLGGVLRDGTATPSEQQGGRGSSEDPRKSGTEDTKAGKDASEGTSKTDSPENQHDMNSEPNDSSGEEESGEDDHTLMENLSARLEGGGPPSSAGVAKSRSKVSAVEEQNLLLCELRKKLLTCLAGRLGVVEEVGGMRAICYLQVRGSGDQGVRNGVAGQWRLLEGLAYYAQKFSCYAILVCSITTSCSWSLCSSLTLSCDPPTTVWPSTTI